MDKYADITSLLNIKDDDIEILEKNITPNSDTTEYYERVDDDYNGNKVMRISAMEYKNFLLLDFFVKNLFASNIEKWVNYVDVKNQSIQQYNMTLNITKNTVNKINNAGKEESKIVQPNK